jgi:hypothetical protein
VEFAGNVKNCLLLCRMSGSCHIEVWVTIYINPNLTNLIKRVRLFNFNFLNLCWACDKFVGRVKNCQPYLKCPNTFLDSLTYGKKNDNTSILNERSG